MNEMMWKTGMPAVVRASGERHVVEELSWGFVLLSDGEWYWPWELAAPDIVSQLQQWESDGGLIPQEESPCET